MLLDGVGQGRDGDYDAAAGRLRELARELRGQAGRSRLVLEPVLKLDGDATWSGGFPRSVRVMLAGWQRGLEAGADEALRRAADLERVAADYEALAAAFRRVAGHPVTG